MRRKAYIGFLHLNKEDIFTLKKENPLGTSSFSELAVKIPEATTLRESTCILMGPVENAPEREGEDPGPGADRPESEGPSSGNS